MVDLKFFGNNCSSCFVVLTAETNVQMNCFRGFLPNTTSWWVFKWYSTSFIARWFHLFLYSTKPSAHNTVTKQSLRHPLKLRPHTAQSWPEPDTLRQNNKNLAFASPIPSLSFLTCKEVSWFWHKGLDLDQHLSCEWLAFVLLKLSSSAFDCNRKARVLSSDFWRPTF